jgi:regulator of vacuolar morphogenesis
VSFTGGADDLHEDGNYHPDRAWISAPDENTYEALDSSPDAQDLYYLALLDRFAQLQTVLRLSAPLSSIELLSSSQPIAFPPDAAKAREKWRHATKNFDPNPTQLACMDPESVMELVKLLTECMSGTIKSRVHMRVKRLGGWIWATLARCRDRGELSSEEIAELRELGKRAVQLLDYVRRSQSVEAGDQARRREGVAIDLDESMPVEGEGDSPLEAAVGFDGSAPLEAAGDDLLKLEQAKAQMTSMLEVTYQQSAAQIAGGGTDDAEEPIVQTDVDKQIHMLLDTALTIVGEVYGQRDLLEHRDIWN